LDTEIVFFFGALLGACNNTVIRHLEPASRTFSTLMTFAPRHEDIEAAFESHAPACAVAEKTKKMTDARKDRIMVEVPIGVIEAFMPEVIAWVS